ncbi:MAG TPA: PIN domain-containing protein [Rhodanobacteraceae bacterium]|nr:PIN domain-containing protein [Rhodanobacteraceae bacterium]
MFEGSTHADVVLERRYRYPRAAIADVASRLLEHGKYRVVGRELLLHAVEIHRGTRVDFEDALALAHARASDATLISFDRKLTRLEGVEAV